MGNQSEVIVMPNSQLDYELLRTRIIISILDGDTVFGETDTISNGVIKLSLPYLSGPEICKISTFFGLPVTYPRNGGAKSRWEYFNDLLAYCVKNRRISDLLSYLFSKERFAEQLTGCTPPEIDSLYLTIITGAMNRINSALYFGGHELARIGERFVIQKRGEPDAVAVSTPTIDTIDRVYISNISRRALDEIEKDNLDSAITKARTLLEEVFCYVIEQKKVRPSDKGDIHKLYWQVKDLYKIHQIKEQDRRINSLLSGLEKILTAIAEMRNNASDAHGVGARRVPISKHDARLFVNSSITMAEYILSMSDNQGA